MKVLYLHQYFLTLQMKGGTRSFEFARRLAKLGHEVIVITADQSDNSKKEYETEEAGITVHWLPIAYNNKLSFYKRVWSFLKFAFAASRKMGVIQADVILSTSPPLTIALPALYGSKRFNIPLVFEVRDLWPEVAISLGILKNKVLISLARQLEKLTYSAATHLIALSPEIKSHILRICPGKEVTVIPNACDFSLFQMPASLPSSLRYLEGKKVVLYAGVLGEANDTSYIVRLAHALLKQERDIIFLLLGNGKEEEKVRLLASELGVLEKNLFFHPFIKKEEVPAIFSLAKASIVTLRDIKILWTGSPNKIADSLAAGVPVLMNFGGWLSELIQKQGAGIRLDEDDLDKAAGKVMNFFDCEHLQNVMSQAAYHLGKSQFCREKLSSVFESVLVQTQNIGGAHRIGFSKFHDMAGI